MPYANLCASYSMYLGKMLSDATGACAPGTFMRRYSCFHIIIRSIFIGFILHVYSICMCYRYIHMRHTCVNGLNCTNTLHMVTAAYVEQ